MKILPVFGRRFRLHTSGRFPPPILRPYSIALWTQNRCLSNVHTVEQINTDSTESVWRAHVLCVIHTADSGLINYIFSINKKYLQNLEPLLYNTKMNRGSNYEKTVSKIRWNCLFKLEKKSLNNYTYMYLTPGSHWHRRFWLWGVSTIALPNNSVV